MSTVGGTGNGGGPDGDALVFRSPDRLIRVGLTICGTALASGPLLAVTLLVHSAEAALVLLAVHVAGLALCRRIAGECCAVDAVGIVDRRTFRRQAVRWQDVAAVVVDDPGRPWGGLCVRVHPRRGAPFPLLGTRHHPSEAAPEGWRALHDAHASIERRLLQRSLPVTAGRP